MSHRAANGKKMNVEFDSSVAHLQKMKSKEIAAQKEMKSSELCEMKHHHLIMEEVETKHQKSEGEVTKSLPTCLHSR